LIFPRQIFEKYPDIKFNENLMKWGPNCSMQTDGEA